MVFAARAQNHADVDARQQQPLFVRATEFEYEPGDAFTYLAGVVQAGFKYDTVSTTWERAEMPKLVLTFQKPVINDELSALPEDSLEGLAGGTDGGRKQWLDLNGEGIPGVLVDQGGSWFYKENAGSGELRAPRRLSTLPNPSALAGGAQTLEDLDGDGRLELVSRTQSANGYFTRTADGEFEPMRSFDSVPNINWSDPNLRIIDLNGDGHGDILITEDQAFVWYRSKAKEGFDESKRVAVSFDENEGPRVVFSDSEQSIQLADMSGDGLVDIVRVRNGEVSYWPNLGYGRFGKKNTLEKSPVFAGPDEFHASRIRFGDIDGSGASDIFYMGAKGTQLYFNGSGNVLSSATVIRALPPVDKLSQISVVDLLGTGTSCLVWTSPIENSSRNILYVDIMGSKKPHLLVEVDNNLGAVTRTTYASSTKFYLADKKAGIQWLTRLPFPVHVVERTEAEDKISGAKFVSRYSYRHGFFDGYEREFRGFARVEQLDAEDFAEEGSDPLLYQSPVRTVSWFHTGAWLEKERLELALQVEYFQGGPPALLVKDTVLPQGLSVQDEREAARALKGSPLRQEVYAQDGGAQEGLPYVTTETNQEVRMLQESRGENRHGVFLAYSRESVSTSSERNLGDPRVAHEMVLDVDEYGAVTRKVSIVYGRGTGAPEQRRDYATLAEMDYVHQDSEANVYRLGTEVESRSFEITGLTLPSAGAGLADVDSLRGILDTLDPTNDLDFDEAPTTGVQRRAVDRSQQSFYTDDAAAEAVFGQVGLRALPYKSYQLALTSGNVTQLVTESGILTGTGFDPALLVAEGKHEDRESNGQYWGVSGRAIFSTVEFYLPVAALDPFGGAAGITWDEFKLLPTSATDPVGNIVVSENDYRVLSPSLVTDPNLNRSEVAFDALGMLVATAVMGKDNGANEGDTISEPTVRLEYDLLAYQERGEPSFAKTMAREEHGAANPRFQESYAYSDGFGRVIQQKVQAEPGEAPLRNPDGTLQRDTNGDLVFGPVSERWVGTGRTIFNNKGNPVKQYEPFFSSTFSYEMESDLVEFGVTPTIRYDSIDRVIRTDLPDGTFTRVEFDAWSQKSFDQNDTVLDSQWYVDRGSPSPIGGKL